MRMVFLDLSKAFDKVWHKGLLYKLKALRIRDPLLSWFKSYLSGRKQRVVINGQSSVWNEILAGVPKGSVLGPLLFLVYINDIPENLQTDCFLYADDTSLLEIVENPIYSAAALNNDLEQIHGWTRTRQKTLNRDKTKALIFSTKHIKPHNIRILYLITRL